MSRGPRSARRAAKVAEGRPVRTCVACRARRTQDVLVRVSLHDGVLVVDDASSSSRRPGRGAYLCDDTSCVARALQRDASLLRRALRTRLTAVVSEELGRVGLPAS